MVSKPLVLAKKNKSFDRFTTAFCNGANARPLFQKLTTVTEYTGFGENDNLQNILETRLGIDFIDNSIKWYFINFL